MGLLKENKTETGEVGKSSPFKGRACLHRLRVAALAKQGRQAGI